MMRDMLADVKPQTVVVNGTAAPAGFFERSEQPGVIALSELGERLFAGFADGVLIKSDVVALDRGAGSVAEIHGGAPLRCIVGGEFIEVFVVKGHSLIKDLGGGEVKHERAYCVSVFVKKKIEVLPTQTARGTKNGWFHPGEHGNDRADLRAITGLGAN